MDTSKRDEGFVRKTWDFYAQNRRSFIWRETPKPYWVFVSELMLQQTQTTRVAEKFPLFLATFPDFKALAEASLPRVLEQWQGLGYNRRARFLKEAATTIYNTWAGILPADVAILRSLPGIGPNTAASILSFAFNLPTVFLETNIRTVFIDHFFPDEDKVSDDRLLPLVSAHLDRERPRDWYYALMDYGVELKKNKKNEAGRRAKSYVKQSGFKGSRREVRGATVKVLLSEPTGIYEAALFSRLAAMELNPDHLHEAVSALVTEGFVVKDASGLYKLSE